MKQTKFAKALALSTGVLVFSISASYLIFAWTPPGSNPPNPNVAAPINTGGTAQTKEGALTTGGLMSTGGGDSGGYLTLLNSTKINPGIANQWKIYNMTGTYGNSLQFWVYDTIGCGSGLCANRMTITDGGNVGIGTGSPAGKLDIADNGAGAGTQFLRIGDDAFLADIDAANTLGIYGLQNNAVSAIKLGSGGGTIAGYNGNVGIGTNTPDGTLYVTRGTANGGTAVFAGTNNKSHFNYSVDEDTYIRGGKTNSKVIINDNGGNVGIGTNTPGQKLDVAGYVKARDGLCIGDDCCTSWAECLGGGGPFIPVGGCTADLPAGNKKIFVTSIVYDDYVVHTPNLGSTMENADRACQTRASAAGLTGIYRALMYEIACKQGTSNCNLINIARRPHDVLPSAALWNGEKIGTTTNCEWYLVATDPNDMFSVDASGNYLQNPIQFNELGQLTNAQVFTNFQPTGSGAYNYANTCYQTNTCHYYWDGCYYGQSTSKNQNWAGTYSGHWNPGEVGQPANCPAVCDTVQRALYCVEQ